MPNLIRRLFPSKMLVFILDELGVKLSLYSS